MFEQRENRSLAIIERDVVDIIEDARLFQFAQLGIHPAATEHRDDFRVVCLDRLGHAECSIDRAGEGHGKQHDIGIATVNGKNCQFFKSAVDQRWRSRQSSGQWLERRLAAGQRFGVADEFKARIDCLAQHVCEIVQIQRGQMPRPVLHAERPESPGQRVAAVFVDINIQWFEARAFRQKISAGNAKSHRRITSLQEGDGWGHSGQIAVELLAKIVDDKRVLAWRQAIYPLANGFQAVRRKEFEDQFERYVLLHRVDPA